MFPGAPLRGQHENPARHRRIRPRPACGEVRRRPCLMARSNPPRSTSSRCTRPFPCPARRRRLAMRRSRRITGMRAKLALKGVGDFLRQRGLAFIEAARIGAVDKEINQYVRDHAIDLIVMGTHGRTALASVAMGSVALETDRNHNRSRSRSFASSRPSPRRFRQLRLRTDSVGFFAGTRRNSDSQVAGPALPPFARVRLSPRVRAATSASTAATSSIDAGRSSRSLDRQRATSATSDRGSVRRSRRRRARAPARSAPGRRGRGRSAVSKTRRPVSRK